MKNWLALILLIGPVALQAQKKTIHKVTHKSETALQQLPFGSIRPTGWLKNQMQQDVDGFVGHLDQLVPDLIQDPIYGAARLHAHSELKDLGNLKSGDAAGDDQYKWWNSETQSNWWDGYLRNVLLLRDSAGMKKSEAYISRILATQDADGYLGIYDPELRYRFNSENGELWSKATLYRGLLAFYEYTRRQDVFEAVRKAVENVMVHYPIHASSPFSSGRNFNGGVSHGLTFTDVLDQMYTLTKDTRYLQYALFLYEDYSRTYQTEADAQIKNLLNPSYRLKSHGVHTYEHLRPLTVAANVSRSARLKKALDIYLKRIESATTITGGPIGDEWIAERTADATQTGYEYCSIQELMDSYSLLFQKSGDPHFGDAIETIFYNAAQGARNPEHSGIAYLKTDNSFEMLGTRNGFVEADRKQTRYKYSPAHQDVAVCCNPNAGRISPYFVQKSWMKENDQTLVATLLMPNEVNTRVAGTLVTIQHQTNYPYDHRLRFKITLNQPTRFTLKIRKPSWVTHINTAEKYQIQQGYIVITRLFSASDEVQLLFDADVLTRKDPQQSYYFSYGALVYAKSLEALALPGKVYLNGFTDWMYEPVSPARYRYLNQPTPVCRDGKLHVRLLNENSGLPEETTLIPIGKTILRQVTFR